MKTSKFGTTIVIFKYSFRRIYKIFIWIFTLNHQKYLFASRKIKQFFINKIFNFNQIKDIRIEIWSLPNVLEKSIIKSRLNSILILKTVLSSSWISSSFHRHFANIRSSFDFDTHSSSPHSIIVKWRYILHRMTKPKNC